MSLGTDLKREFHFDSVGFWDRLLFVVEKNCVEKCEIPPYVTNCPEVILAQLLDIVKAKLKVEMEILNRDPKSKILKRKVDIAVTSHDGVALRGPDVSSLRPKFVQCDVPADNNRARLLLRMLQDHDALRAHQTFFLNLYLGLQFDVQWLNHNQNTASRKTAEYLELDLLGRDVPEVFGKWGPLDANPFDFYPSLVETPSWLRLHSAMAVQSKMPASNVLTCALNVAYSHFRGCGLWITKKLEEEEERDNKKEKKKKEDSDPEKPLMDKAFNYTNFFVSALWQSLHDINVVQRDVDPEFGTPPFFGRAVDPFMLRNPYVMEESKDPSSVLYGLDPGVGYESFRCFPERIREKLRSFGGWSPRDFKGTDGGLKPERNFFGWKERDVFGWKHPPSLFLSFQQMWTFQNEHEEEMALHLCVLKETICEMIYLHQRYKFHLSRALDFRPTRVPVRFDKEKEVAKDEKKKEALSFWFRLLGRSDSSLDDVLPPESLYEEALEEREFDFDAMENVSAHVFSEATREHQKKILEIVSNYVFLMSYVHNSGIRECNASLKERVKVAMKVAFSNKFKNRWIGSDDRAFDHFETASLVRLVAAEVAKKVAPVGGTLNFRASGPIKTTSEEDKTTYRMGEYLRRSCWLSESVGPFEEAVKLSKELDFFSTFESEFEFEQVLFYLERHGHEREKSRSNGLEEKAAAEKKAENESEETVSEEEEEEKKEEKDDESTRKTFDAYLTEISERCDSRKELLKTLKFFGSPKSFDRVSDSQNAPVWHADGNFVTGRYFSSGRKLVVTNVLKYDLVEEYVLSLYNLLGLTEKEIVTSGWDLNYRDEKSRSAIDLDDFLCAHLLGKMRAALSTGYKSRRHLKGAVKVNTEAALEEKKATEKAANSSSPPHQKRNESNRGRKKGRRQARQEKEETLEPHEITIRFDHDLGRIRINGHPVNEDSEDKICDPEKDKRLKELLYKRTQEDCWQLSGPPACGLLILFFEIMLDATAYGIGGDENNHASPTARNSCRALNEMILGAIRYDTRMQQPCLLKSLAFNETINSLFLTSGIEDKTMTVLEEEGLIKVIKVLSGELTRMIKMSVEESDKYCNANLQEWESRQVQWLMDRCWDVRALGPLWKEDKWQPEVFLGRPEDVVEGTKEREERDHRSRRRNRRKPRTADRRA